MNNRYRPRYHFTPPANWMNDPNGLIQWKGQYHLFYQHNPNGAYWDNMHWGHAVSDDLIHWRHLPIALTPTPNGADKDGCWSGCIVDNNGIPTLLYTGVWPEVQLLATSADDLLTWQKYENNPIIAAPPPHLKVTGFRDPCVWNEDGIWYMVLGAGVENTGGTLLLYQSLDLIKWDYVQQILSNDAVDTVWECPCFFALRDKQVLLFSEYAKWNTQYYVGTFRDFRMTPEVHALADIGGYFYAPHTFLDDHGRRILFGWIREARDEEAHKADGWAGIQSLPRELTLRPDNTLGVSPVAEVEQLRYKQIVHRQEMAVATVTPLDEIQSNCLEIVAEFMSGDAQQFGINLCCSPDMVEYTSLVCDMTTRSLYVDHSHDGGALSLDPNESLELHIFLDVSVIEVYINNRACLTTRIYPTRDDSLGLQLFAKGGTMQLKNLSIWEMKHI